MDILTIIFFAFTSNADASNGLVFGKHIENWLVYTLIFLGLTSISFVWTWVKGIMNDKNSGDFFKQPWE